MLKVGITGGIGSGKTTVCKLFEALQVPIYYADDRAKWLMQNDSELMDGLREAFGSEVYTGAGLLNRGFLAEIVFNDSEKLALLNGLVHPAVHRDNEEWQAAQAAQGSVYTLKEAALLYESGANYQLDKIIVVSAPLEARIARVMQRDNCAREAVLARIDKQMPQSEKENMADFVVINENQDALAAQVQRLHEQLLKLAQRA